jgi:uncharacterized protein YgfB (UPF0149 family)
VAFITHEQLNARLLELQLSVTADALHGAITGLACAGYTPADDSWLLQLTQSLDGIELDAQAEAMAALHTLCVRDLTQGDFSFQLLLPDGDEFLSVRTFALSHWCGAFVAGFAGVRRTLNSEDEEVLMDLTAISYMDTEKDYNNPSEAQENERDFMELCEYTRLAAMELYVLLGTLEPAAPLAADTDKPVDLKADPQQVH